MLILESMKKFIPIFCIYLSMIWMNSAKADYSVLIHPESHTNDLQRDVFTRSLEEFKNAGFRYLAMEMFKDNRQKELDLYFESPQGNISIIENLLKTEWAYNTDSYLQMMNQAVHLGFKIIALDMPKKDVPKEDLPSPVPPKLSNNMKARNKRMAFNISEVIKKDSNAKILVLVGAYHAESDGIPKVLIEDYGIHSLSDDLDNFYYKHL
jgi:uncharacterized iron-regulated protein